MWTAFIRNFLPCEHGFYGCSKHVVQILIQHWHCFCYIRWYHCLANYCRNAYKKQKLSINNISSEKKTRESKKILILHRKKSYLCGLKNRPNIAPSFARNSASPQDLNIPIQDSSCIISIYYVRIIFSLFSGGRHRLLQSKALLKLKLELTTYFLKVCHFEKVNCKLLW